MVIYLSSFFDESTHGPGRKIGVCPSKPKNLDYECELVFAEFSPEQLYWDYLKERREDPEGALLKFTTAYTNKLESFFKNLGEIITEKGCTVQEILPFKDGDTLLSWEKNSDMSFRGILGEFLSYNGYNVIYDGAVF